MKEHDFKDEFGTNVCLRPCRTDEQMIVIHRDGSPQIYLSRLRARDLAARILAYLDDDVPLGVA